MANKERVERLKSEIGYVDNPKEDDKRVRCSECDFSQRLPKTNQDHFRLVCYYKKSEFTVRQGGTCDYGEVGIF